MARPERNNVDYFPFICEDGNKMFYIEETYGNDGFATFVKLLRELAKTNYHYLDLSKPTTVMFLSAKCKINKETLLSIIKDLVELGKFDSDLWNDNSIIWCQDFVDSIQDAYNKRNNKCITLEGLLLLLTSLGVRKQSKCTTTVPINPQSIVKYSKEDNIIQNETVVLDAELIEYSFNDFWLLYPNKTNKKKAEEKFNKLNKQQKEKIENHLPFFISHKPFKEYNFPHATTYITQERFNDEINLNTNLQNGKQPLTTSEQFKQITQAIRADGVRR